MSPSLAFKLMARESRGALGKIVFFTACLAVGVAAVVSVAGLSSAVEGGLRKEAKQLLAADLAVTAEQTIPTAVVTAVEDLLAARPGARRTQTREMATVIFRPPSGSRAGASALVLLKAVEEGYPFYGEVRTDPSLPLGKLLDPDGVLIAPELAAELGLSTGSLVRIGGRDFVVRGGILAEPDKVNVSFTLGPRVLVSLEGLARAGLEAFGSRLDRAILVKLPDGATAQEVESAAATLRDALPSSSGVRVKTYGDAQPALRDGLRRAEKFLGLVALVSLVLGGIGVAQTVRAWLASRLDAIAVLKCLGVRPREVVALYAGQTALLGLAGSVLGAITGTILLAAAPRLLSGLLPPVPIEPWQPGAVGRGLALGTGVALLFSVAPLSALRLVPPLRVIRRDAEPLEAGIGARLLVAAALVLGVFGAAYVQSGSTVIAGVFTAGMAAAAAALAGSARLTTLLIARASRERMRVAWRQGLAAIARPGAGTLPAITSLGLGVLVVVAMSLVERGITSRLRADLPEESPNVFLVDIQPTQWPRVRSILEETGAVHVATAPIVTARLVSVDGIPTAELASRVAREGRRDWILTREQNLTFLDALPKDNVVVEGGLWNDPQRAEVSIERDFARDMGVGVGSSVVFDIQGVPVELAVTSLRTVDWKSFGINFFLVVEPGVLDEAPQMRVAAAQVPPGREQVLQNRLAAEVPNVTLLKVREIVEKVARVLDRLGQGIRLLGGFAIVAGIAILAGAVSATASRRGREVALLKTLGATRGNVVAIFVVEFALTGLIAGLVGTTGGAALAWAVLTRLMEIDWTWMPLVLVAAPLLSATLSVVAGVAASAGALRKRPIEVLRAE